MKKLLLLAAAVILVGTWTSNAVNSMSGNSTNSSPNCSLPLSATRASHSAAAAKRFAAFQRYHSYIDHSFQRLKSVQQAALELHTSVAAMNEAFRPYAHEDANKYLMSLKRTQTHTAALASQKDNLVER